MQSTQWETVWSGNALEILDRNSHVLLCTTYRKISFQQNRSQKIAYSLRTFPTLLKGLCHGGSMEPQKLDNSSRPGSLIVHRKGVPKS